LTLILAIAGEVRAHHYDPLAIDPAFRPLHVNLTVHEAARNRDIPVRVYLPTNPAPEPVVLFSHRLGSSRAGSVFLGEHRAVRFCPEKIVADCCCYCGRICDAVPVC
jgi:predicted dienelactone hydrolase